PWIAFNQKNYRKCSSLKKEEMIKELERILVGNVLSFLKGCKITADCRIVAKIKCIRPVKVVAHSNAFMSFRGCFTLNLYLPDHIGLGKSASKGFGTIRKVGLYKGPAENQLANHHAQKEPLEASVCQKK
ncbi:MAG: CRISPR-associated endonuclease Cas6, partial [Candidatus Micrarchaeota archaeon]|nr:CRISPR-associated endonuclease Cas6 [Candidatus Micrarchaeota archaeon]